eukprot:COSAG02_NODE_22653_length_745_cov_0.795666_2_plen_38_part_01
MTISCICGLHRCNTELVVVRQIAVGVREGLYLLTTVFC